MPEECLDVMIFNLTPDQRISQPESGTTFYFTLPIRSQPKAS